MKRVGVFRLRDLVLPSAFLIFRRQTTKSSVRFSADVTFCPRWSGSLKVEKGSEQFICTLARVADPSSHSDIALDVLRNAIDVSSYTQYNLL